MGLLTLSILGLLLVMTQPPPTTTTTITTNTQTDEDATYTSSSAFPQPNTNTAETLSIDSSDDPSDQTAMSTTASSVSNINTMQTVTEVTVTADVENSTTPLDTGTTIDTEPSTTTPDTTNTSTTTMTEVDSTATTITNDGDTPSDITDIESISSTDIQLIQTTLPTELPDTSGTTPQPGAISVTVTTALETDTQPNMTTAETVSMTVTSDLQSDKTTIPSNTDTSTESNINTTETTNEEAVTSNVENNTTILPTTLTATTQPTTWTAGMVTSVISHIATGGSSSNTNNTMAATTTVVSYSNTTPLDTGMTTETEPITTTLHTTTTAAAIMTDVEAMTTTIVIDGVTYSNISGTESISSTGIQPSQTTLPTELPHTSGTTPQPDTISVTSSTATLDTDTQPNMTTAETVSMTVISGFQSDKTTIPSNTNTSTESNINTMETTNEATVTSNVENYRTILPTTLTATTQPITWTTDMMTSITSHTATEESSSNTDNTMAATTTVVSNSNTTPLHTGMTTDTEPITTTLHTTTTATNTMTEVERMTTTIINNRVTFSNITGTESISSRPTGIQLSQTTSTTELLDISLTTPQPDTISILSPTGALVTDTQPNTTTAGNGSMTVFSGFQSDKTTIPSNTNTSTESNNNTVQTTSNSAVTSNVERYTTALPIILTSTTQPTTWTTDTITSATSSIATGGFSSNTNNTMVTTTGIVSNSNTSPMDTGTSARETSSIATIAPNIPSNTSLDPISMSPTVQSNTNTTLTVNFSINTASTHLSTTAIPTSTITFTQPNVNTTPTANQGTTVSNAESGTTTGIGHPENPTSDALSSSHSPGFSTANPFITSAISPTSISTTTIPTTMSPSSESVVSLEIYLDLKFEEDLKNSSSEKFKTLAKNLTQQLDMIYKKTYGDSFSHSEVKGFRNGSVVVTVSLVFSNFSAVRNISDVVKTLRDAGESSEFSFRGKIIKIMLLVPTKPPATTIIIPTTLSAKTTTVASQSQHTTAVPIISVATALTKNSDTQTTNPSSTSLKTSAATSVQPIRSTAHPTNTAPYSTNIKSDTSAPFAGSTAFTQPSANATETVQTIVTSHSQSGKITTPITAVTKSDMAIRQTTSIAAVTSNIENMTPALPKTLTATSSIATGGFNSNTNNTMVTTTGIVRNSNTSPMDTGTSARESSSIATIAPNIPSNTSLDPISMSPTVQSNTNTTLTVNFSISTASIHLSTTAIPTSTITFTQPNVNTTPTTNQGTTVSNAESGTTTGIGHPENPTSDALSSSHSPGFSTANPFITSVISPTSISTTTIPTTMPPSSESVVSLEIYLDLKFEEDLKNSSSEKFKTLSKNLTQQLDMIYKKTYGDSFSHSEVKGFRNGSVVVTVSLVFSNFSAVRNISDVVKTLRDAGESSEFSFRGKIIKIILLVPTKPPATTIIIPTTLSAKTTTVASQSQHTTAVPIISVATALTKNSDTQTTNPSSTSLKTSAATSVQPIRSTAHPTNTAPYSTNIKSDTSAPFAGRTAFTQPSANATETVQTIVTSHSQSGKITTPITAVTKSDMAIRQTTSIAAVTSNIENMTPALPKTLTATSSIATGGFNSNTNNTMVTTTGIVRNSNTSPMDTGTSARESSSIATIAPNIPSNTSLDPISMSPTVQSNTNTTLTVNFSISTASTHLSTTAIPTSTITFTQPNVNTTPTTNQGTTVSNAESGTTTGIGHPENPTSDALSSSHSPGFSTANPFITSVISPTSISTTTIPTTMPPSSESVVSLEIYLDLKFEEDLKNSSSEKFKTLSKNLTQQLDMIYKKTYGDSFSHSEVKGFRNGSVVVTVSLVFSNFSAVRNISDVVKTLRDAGESSEFSFRGKIIKIILLVPTKPPATTIIIPTTLSAKTTTVASQSQHTTAVLMISVATALTKNSDTQTTNPSSTSLKTSAATSVQPIRSTAHPTNTAPYSTNIKSDTSAPFAGRTAFTQPSANATETVQTIVTSHSQSGKITTPTTAVTKSDVAIRQTTSTAAVTSNIENMTTALPKTLTVPSSIATGGFNSNTNNTMVTTTGIVRNSNTSPMDTGTSARESSSIATIAPNIPSNTSLDPISMSPTVQSNTNTTLTVNFSINTASTHLSTTAIPTSTITFTQPNVNTTPTTNQRTTASNAERVTTTGIGKTITPTNAVAFTKSDMTTTQTTNISIVTSNIKNITTAIPTTLTTTTQPTTWTTYMANSTTGFTNTQTVTASTLKSTIAFIQPILNVTQSGGTVIPEVSTKSFSPALYTTMAATKGSSSNITATTTTTNSNITTTTASQNNITSLYTGTTPTSTTLRTTNSVRFTVTQINTATTAMKNNGVTTPNITVTAVSSPGIPPSRTTSSTEPLHTSDTTPQPATTSVISTTTAVTTASVKTVQLQFSLQKEFTAELSIPSSNEFKQLAKNITVEMDKIYSQKFPRSFIRSTVLGFRKGSVVADMHLLFKEKQSNDEVVSSSSVQTALHTVVSQSTNNSLFFNIIPTSIQALEEISVSVNLSLILPFSSSLNDSHSPEYIQLSTTLNNWLGAVFSKFFGNVSRSSATQFRNIDGWVGAHIVFKFNVETRIADDVLTAAVLNSQSPFLYLKHLLSVNGFQVPADFLLISMRITSLHFTEELTYRGSATFLLYSTVIRTSVIKLYKGKDGFIDVYVTRMMPGSVVAQLVIVFDKSRISTHDVSQILLSGLPQLEFDGLTVDPSSMQIVSQPVTSPRPFPGYAVAIIVMCGLAIILLPVAVLVGCRTGMWERLRRSLSLRSQNYSVTAAHHVV
ncbi:mucin-3A-like [Megalops cyprinoides]|uniref:mucin-3A-like n=1 Tax=Megalops cyprinoides TaxID=118141 RepID=UPI001864CF65|nr:mucin-3A-like [Megalops cyprinoides]